MRKFSLNQRELLATKFDRKDRDVELIVIAVGHVRDSQLTG